MKTNNQQRLMYTIDETLNLPSPHASSIARYEPQHPEDLEIPFDWNEQPDEDWLETLEAQSHHDYYEIGTSGTW